MTGVLGQMRPSGGSRDLTGMIAWRRNTARSRLEKRGADVSRLTIEDLDREADRWDREQAGQVQNAEPPRARSKFLQQLRESGSGDIVGPDSNGAFWQISEDGETLYEVKQP